MAMIDGEHEDIKKRLDELEARFPGAMVKPTLQPRVEELEGKMQQAFQRMSQDATNLVAGGVWGLGERIDALERRVEDLENFDPMGNPDDDSPTATDPPPVAPGLLTGERLVSIWKGIPYKDALNTWDAMAAILNNEEAQRTAELRGVIGEYLADIVRLREQVGRLQFIVEAQRKINPSPADGINHKGQVIFRLQQLLGKRNAVVGRLRERVRILKDQHQYEEKGSQDIIDKLKDDAARAQSAYSLLEQQRLQMETELQRAQAQRDEALLKLADQAELDYLKAGPSADTIPAALTVAGPLTGERLWDVLWNGIGSGWDCCGLQDEYNVAATILNAEEAQRTAELQTQHDREHNAHVCEIAELQKELQRAQSERDEALLKLADQAELDYLKAGPSADTIPDPWTGERLHGVMWLVHPWSQELHQNRYDAGAASINADIERRTKGLRDERDQLKQALENSNAWRDKWNQEMLMECRRANRLGELVHQQQQMLQKRGQEIGRLRKRLREASTEEAMPGYLKSARQQNERLRERVAELEDRNAELVDDWEKAAKRVAELESATPTPPITEEELARELYRVWGRWERLPEIEDPVWIEVARRALELLTPTPRPFWYLCDEPPLSATRCPKCRSCWCDKHMPTHICGPHVNPALLELSTINIVFDGPPGPEAGRFVEVENDAGESIKVGEWYRRMGDPDYWVLKIPIPQAPAPRKRWAADELRAIFQNDENRTIRQDWQAVADAVNDTMRED